LLVWWVSASSTPFLQDLRSDTNVLGISTSRSDLYWHCFPSLGGCPPLVFFPGAALTTKSIRRCRMLAPAKLLCSTSLTESKVFFRRLEVYIGLPPTVEMTATIVNVMAEVLRILALVTKEIKQRFFSKLTLDDRAPPRLIILQRNSLRIS